MDSLATFANKRLQELSNAHLKRNLVQTDISEPPYVIRNGKKLLSFGSNDYFGMAQHPEVIKAATKATEQFGTGATSSRLVMGNHPLYQTLEKRTI